MGHSFYLGDDLLTEGIQPTLEPAPKIHESYIPRDPRVENSRVQSDEIKKFLESEPPVSAQAYKRRSLDRFFNTKTFLKQPRYGYRSSKKPSQQNITRSIVRHETTHGNIYYKIERGPEHLASSDDLSAFRVNFPEEDAMKPITDESESHKDATCNGELHAVECQVESPQVKAHFTHNVVDMNTTTNLVPSSSEISADNASDYLGISKECPYLLLGTTTQHPTQSEAIGRSSDISASPISFPRQRVESNARDFATPSSKSFRDPSTFDVSRHENADTGSYTGALVTNSSTVKVSSIPRKLAHPKGLTIASPKVPIRKPIKPTTILQTPSKNSLRYPVSDTETNVMHSSVLHGTSPKSSSDSNPQVACNTTGPVSKTLVGKVTDMQGAYNGYLKTPSSPGPAPTTPLPLPPNNNSKWSPQSESGSPHHPSKQWSGTNSNALRSQAYSPPRSPMKMQKDWVNGFVSPSQSPSPTSSSSPNAKSPYPQYPPPPIPENHTPVVEKPSAAPGLAIPSELIIKRKQSRQTLKRADIERARTETKVQAIAASRNQADQSVKHDAISSVQHASAQGRLLFSPEPSPKTGSFILSETKPAPVDTKRDKENLIQLTPTVVIAEESPTNCVQEVQSPKIRVPHQINDRAEGYTLQDPTISAPQKSLLHGMNHPLCADPIRTASQRSSTTGRPATTHGVKSPSPDILQLIADLETRLEARFTAFEMQHEARLTEIEAALFRMQNGSVGVSRQTSGRWIGYNGSSYCNGNVNGNGNSNGNGNRYSGDSNGEKERSDKVQERLWSMINSMNGEGF